MKALIMAAGPGRRMGRITNFSDGLHLGNMPKPSLPIVNRPIISRAVDQLVSRGVTDIWVTSHHMAGDILKILGHGDRFGIGVKIRHEVEYPLVHTAMAVKNIAAQFKNQPFWVLSGDIFSPETDFTDFYNSFKRAQNVSRSAIGCMGLALRPFSELQHRATVAIVDRRGLIESFEEPLTRDESEAGKIFDLIKYEKIKRLSDKLKVMLFPTNSSTYLFTNKIFSLVPEPETNPTDLYDFGYYVFKKMPPRSLAAYFIPEKVQNGKLAKTWTDVGYPEDLWRANFRLIKYAPHLIGLRFVPEMQSWIADGTKVRGTVRNSVIGKNVFIGPGVRVENSIIGPGSTIESLEEISGSIVFPYIYINTRRYARRVERITQSILVSRPQGGAFIDAHSIGGQRIEKRVAIPNIDGDIVFDDLYLNDKEAQELLKIR
jgi:NDP-sugar pyrophosphorylase family protein